MIQLILLAFAALFFIVLGKQIWYIRTNPLRKFNGPKSRSYLFGNVKDTFSTVRRMNPANMDKC